MILVDSLQQHAVSPLGPRAWCHMVSDTSMTELHAFAAQIGMKRAWFQGDHYDLVASRRAAAVRMGAAEVSSQDLVKRMVGQRGDRLRALLSEKARP
jgi:hypothetical protein